MKALAIGVYNMQSLGSSSSYSQIKHVQIPFDYMQQEDAVKPQTTLFDQVLGKKQRQKGVASGPTACKFCTVFHNRPLAHSHIFRLRNV
eukprot:1149051-Pelagomonas_calceolata.AAC.1